MYLPSGTLLLGGRYKIIRFISAGGFGCTYEGYHILLKKRVAIKEFFVKDFCNRDESTSNVSIGTTSKTALVEKLKGKFIQEAQTVSSLSHPNIVNVQDIFEENGTAYFVMDYIDGPSLNDIIKKQGSLSEREALKYICQIADALGHVHSHNRLHLDIKPGNIMINKSGNAVLIDFGASKQYDEVAGENTSTLIGKTPGYAPPEQMGNDVVKFTPSTDIYALGATLYKLLTGTTPLSANLLISGEELPPLPSSVSASVRNAVEKSMQLNKKNRPQSMAEFLQLLGNIGTSADNEETKYAEDEEVTINVISEVESETLTKTSGTQQTSNAESLTKPKKKAFNWKLFGGIAIAVATILLISITVLWSQSTDSGDGNTLKAIADDSTNAESTEVAAADGYNDFPWDFPKSIDLEFEADQYYLAPYTFYPSAVEEKKDLTHEALIFYHDTYNDVTDGKVNGKTPTSLCIPLPKGETAKKGDVVLTWWQSGSGLQRALVTDDSTPDAPKTVYIDLNYKGDGSGFAEKYIDQLKPNSFKVLTNGELEPGAPVAYFEDGTWKSAICVNTAGDKVLVEGFASHIYAVKKDNVKVIPLVPEYKEGDMVSVVVVDYYSDGYTVKRIDMSLGRVWVEKNGREDIKNIFEVTNSLNTSFDFSN